MRLLIRRWGIHIVGKPMLTVVGDISAKDATDVINVLFRF